MSNTSSASRRDGRSSRGNFLHNLTRRTFNSLRRLLFNRTIRLRSRSTNTDLGSFERLLREEFSVDSTSDSDFAQHLATVHVSYTETSKSCTIYVTGYNNSHDKIMEGIVDQDLRSAYGSECYITYTKPQLGTSFNRRFRSPFQAKDIKAFFDQFSSKPEGSA